MTSGAVETLASMWLVVLAALVAPRIVFGAMWYFGDRVDLAFDTNVWPILGVIFVPWASILYVLLWSPVEGVMGYEWIIVGVAGVVDVISWASRLAKAQNPY